MTQPLTLQAKVFESVQSGQSGIWIRSHEHDEAITTLAALAKERQWEMVLWDAVNQSQELWKTQGGEDDLHQPEPSIQAVLSLYQEALQRQVKESGPHRLLVIRNGHCEIAPNGMIQKELLMALQQTMDLGKGYHCHILLLSYPGIPIPLELQELVWAIDHDLPALNERAEILRDLLEPDIEHEDVPQKYLDIAKPFGGLTRAQVEGVAAVSLLDHDEIQSDDVWRLKSELVNKKGILSLYKGKETFEDLGGLEGLKTFSKKALEPGKPEHVRARAFLLLGIPGTGKSAFCKALGNEMARATLTMDIGALMGGLVGQTEENTREALRVADAMEPCQLFVDEVEKALGTGGDNDGGVSSRLRGSMLTWLNDHTSDVLFIATANDIRALPPEFTRAERFDGIFFMDLPSREAKNAIWKIYLAMFQNMNITNFEAFAEDRMPDDSIWTGAEIRACCRLAALLDVSLQEAAQQVVPVMMTAKEQIEQLRKWAHHRCLDAETGHVYSSEKAIPIPKAAAGGRTRRRGGRRRPVGYDNTGENN